MFWHYSWQVIDASSERLSACQSFVWKKRHKSFLTFKTVHIHRTTSYTQQSAIITRTRIKRKLGGLPTWLHYHTQLSNLFVCPNHSYIMDEKKHVTYYTWSQNETKKGWYTIVCTVYTVCIRILYTMLKWKMVWSNEIQVRVRKERRRKSCRRHEYIINVCRQTMHVYIVYSWMYDKY